MPVDKIQSVLPQLHAMGFVDSNIAQLSAEVGEKIVGRTGGAVSLAIGMAQIFSNIPGLTKSMSYGIILPLCSRHCSFLQQLMLVPESADSSYKRYWKNI